MLFISVVIGKSLLKLLRITGRRGSALPGLVVEKIQPGFLSKTLGQLPRGVVIVTGTNGKTTTTKIISEMLQSQGVRVLTNPTGSNFVRGIIAAVIENISLSGKLPYDVAVFEQDEAHAVKFTNLVKPHGVVALNVMRDQMDRFGEIDTTAKLIGKVIAKTSDWVVLNANDSRISVFKDQVTAKKIVWFGHDKELGSHFLSDDQHYSQNQPKFFSATDKIDVCLQDFADGQTSLIIDGQSHDFVSQLEGAHNALNITAAIAAVETLLPKVSYPELAHGLAGIEPAFGRGEQIVLKDGSRLRLQLVKNPSGFTHSLRALKGQDFGAIGIAINDNYPDGRDVSWLWDVDFSLINHKPVICGGVRAYDMAVRLKYDRIDSQYTVTNLKDFLEKIISLSGKQKPAVIFCTYTAMLALRKMLKSRSQKMNQEGL